MAKRLFIESNGYPCAPMNISDDMWLYVEAKGLHVITGPKGGQGHISWAAIRKALNDRAKAKSRRKS